MIIMSASTTTPFWIKDPSILVKNGNWYKVIPSGQMTENEILNALTLLLLYIAIILLIFSKPKIAIIPVLLIGAIAIYYISINAFVSSKIGHSVGPGERQRIQEFQTRQVSLPGLEPGLSETRHQALSISDRRKLADFLYPRTPTCKDDPAYCGVNVDLRHSREYLG